MPLRRSALRLLPVLLLTACADPPREEDAGASGSTTHADDTTGASGSTSPDVTTTGPLPSETGADSTAGVETDDGDDTTTGPTTCSLPDPAPAWLTPMQQDVIARLSGATEITPGVTLPDRASPARRAAALDHLLDQWSAMGLEGLRHDYAPTGTNAYVVLPAAIETTEAVVVGAHYDTVPGSPGANDDATGVAMVLALSRWLSDVPCRELDVILVLFDEEELGLVGSQAFAAWLLEQPWQVHSVHTIDQMGWDGDGDRAIEIERADEGLLELYELAEPFAPGDTPLTPTNTGFTDHVSFRELGFAAVGLTEEYVSGDTTPHYHLPSDTLDTVQLDYLASSTALLHIAIGRLVAPSAR